MQYLALIYGDESRWATLSPEDREREMGEYMALSQAAVTKGGNELDEVATATTIRVRGDETLVTDGPFAELKEVLGGYYVFECDSIDEACSWAAKIPAARHGAVEVRPIHVDEERPSREVRRAAHQSAGRHRPLAEADAGGGTGGPRRGGAEVGGALQRARPDR